MGNKLFKIEKIIMMSDFLKFLQDKFSQFELNILNIIKNFKVLIVKHHTSSSIFGFFIILTIILQIISGIMLSFSLIPEPMLIPISRDVEDMDVPHIDFIFWMHERGVDLLFIVFYFHLFRKIYLNILYSDQESVWRSGVILLCFLQVVTFLGLVLCCTHLSDITLSIACNIFHTFFNFIGKPYCFIFTDKKLSCDTVVRLAYAHYISAFLIFYLGLSHSVCMHYDWKPDNNYDSVELDLIWYDEVLANEIPTYIDILALLYVFGTLMFSTPEALSYEMFMWGDVGLVNDIRFYGVSPHWYFRPFMAWLTVCPFHKTGIFGLIFFFFLIYNQISIKNRTEELSFIRFKLRSRKNTQFVASRYTLWTKLLFWVFCLCFVYTFTFLPAGRYYQQVYGNNGTLFSYTYIFIYLLNPKFSHGTSMQAFRLLLFIYNMSDLPNWDNKPRDSKKYNYMNPGFKRNEFF